MSYKIPLFDLNFDEKEENAAFEVIHAKWISSGPKCAELEEKFSSMLGVKYSLAVSSCTAALHLAVICADIHSGDEVIVPSLSFVATANVIRYVGAIPVFADIESLLNPTISVKSIEEKITPKTKAIIVMHYAGFGCNMDAIKSIADRHNLKIIEDACHGPMAEYNGKKLGTIGDIGCFSFFSNKNISTGEGGVLVTNSKEIYDRAKLLRSHGMTTMSYERSKGHSTSYDVVELGYNYRMDDIRASIGLVQLDKLKSDVEKRLKVREKYIHDLEKDDRVIIPFRDYPYPTSSYIFPMVLRNADSELRDRVRTAMDSAGIQTSIHYPAIHRFEIYQEFDRHDLTMTESFCDSEITLPMYGKLSYDEIKYITSKIKEILDNG